MGVAAKLSGRTNIPTNPIVKDIRKKSEYVLPSAYIFGDAAGNLQKGTFWRKAFRRAMIAAGFFPVDRDAKGKITEVHNPRNLRPHSFRHSMATLLRDAGTDPAKLQATFGWADEKVMQGYVHWQDTSFEEQRMTVDKILTVDGGAG